MAEPTVEIEASNIHNVGANFQTQDSGTTTESTNVTTMDELGNVACEKVITDILSYTQTVKYCGADFMGDFVDTSEAPVPFLENFGCTFGGKLVNGITINMTAADYCTVDLTSHNHDTNPHDGGATPTGETRADALALGIVDVSDFLPHEVAEAFKDWSGFGVPDFGIVLGANATPKSATVTVELNHVDQVDEQGAHFIGKNITAKCSLTMDMSGIPTSNTSALLNVDYAANTNDMLGCLNDTVAENDTNSDFDAFALTAHAHADLATS